MCKFLSTLLISVKNGFSLLIWIPIAHLNLSYFDQFLKYLNDAKSCPFFGFISQLITLLRVYIVSYDNLDIMC